MSDKGAILGVLRNEDLYGYEISKRLKMIEGFWYIFPGNLYRALNSLLKEKMVEVKRKEEKKGKIRKIYCITDKGRTEFERWLAEPASMPRTRHEPFLKIWFSIGSPENIVIQVEQIRRNELELLGALEKLDLSASPESIRWMIENGKRHVELDLEMTESFLKVMARQISAKRR